MKSLNLPENGIGKKEKLSSIKSSFLPKLGWGRKRN